MMSTSSSGHRYVSQPQKRPSSSKQPFDFRSFFQQPKQQRKEEQRLEDRPSSKDKSSLTPDEELKNTLESLRAKLHSESLNLDAVTSWIQYWVERSLSEKTASLFIPVIKTLSAVLQHRMAQFDKQRQYGMTLPLEELERVSVFADGLVDRCRSLSGTLPSASNQLQSTAHNAVKKAEALLKSASAHPLPTVRKGGSLPAKGIGSSGGMRAKVNLQPGLFTSGPRQTVRTPVQRNRHSGDSVIDLTASQQHHSNRTRKVNLNNPWARDYSFTQNEYPFVERTTVLIKPTGLKNDLKTVFIVNDETLAQIRNESMTVMVCMNSLESGNAICLSSLENPVDMLVNGQCVSFPKHHAKGHHGPIPREAYGVDVTEHCVNGENELLFHSDSFDERMTDIVFGVYITKNRSVTDLCRGVPRLSESECHSHVLNVFGSSSSGSDVSVVSSKVSIKCPLSLARIEMPARSRNCSHLQCFDLRTFLEVNYHTPRFICPICSGEAPFSSLVVDLFFLTILKSIEDDSVKEVELHPNGTWRVCHWGDEEEEAGGGQEVVQGIEESGRSPSPCKSPSDIIVLDDE